MVQTEWNQQTLHQSVDPGSKITRIQYHITDCVDAALHNRPYKVHCDTNSSVHQRTHDRNKSCTAEERKNLRQFNLVITIVESCHSKSYEHTSEHSHLKRCNSTYRCCRSIQQGLCSAANLNHRTNGCMHDEESDNSRKSSNFLLFLRHTNRHTHGKYNRKIRKNNISRILHNQKNGVKYGSLTQDSVQSICCEHRCVTEGTTDSQ